MTSYIIQQNTGRRYRLTIATRPFIIQAVKNTPNKMFIVEAYKTCKENKAYVCYNTEYTLPEGFIREAKGIHTTGCVCVSCSDYERIEQNKTAFYRGF